MHLWRVVSGHHHLAVVELCENDLITEDILEAILFHLKMGH